MRALMNKREKNNKTFTKPSKQVQKNANIFSLQPLRRKRQSENHIGILAETLGDCAHDNVLKPDMRIKAAAVRLEGWLAAGRFPLMKRDREWALELCAKDKF